MRRWEITPKEATDSLQKALGFTPPQSVSTPELTPAPTPKATEEPEKPVEKPFDLPRAPAAMVPTMGRKRGRGRHNTG